MALFQNLSESEIFMRVGCLKDKYLYKHKKYEMCNKKIESNKIPFEYKN